MLKHLILIIFIAPFVIFAQKIEGFINDKLISFEVKDNQLNGSYTAYQKTLDNKGETSKWPVLPFVTGNFSNGQRIGIWTLYDEKGNVKFERNYSSPFEFEQTTPELPDNNAIQLLAKQVYYPIKDSNQFYNYFPLQEREVSIISRVWRELPAEKNTELVNQNIFNDILIKLANGEITAYNHEQFTDTVSRITFKDLTDLELISFRIKEDFFIDITRQMSETRIIGLCPVVKKSEDAEPEELCWLYYPSIRSFLSEYKVDINDPKIENLEDLVFYRNINGSIYKDNRLDAMHEELTKIHPAFNDCYLFELEHEYWKKITGN
jgi:hypothetical protein